MTTKKFLPTFKFPASSILPIYIMNKIFRFRPFYFCLFIYVFCFSAVSQTLSVRDVMREPSLAGMRPDGERLSPDGKLVAFSWNAEGKEPRNLYLMSTSGGDARVIVNAEKNYEMRTPAPESSLNYGLIVRDDFVKAREKNLGGAEFSPDSKRLLFVQNSDIYVLEIDAGKTPFVVSAPRRITRTQGAEVSARWLDDATILYQSSGNFFTLNIEKTFLVQLTREANPAAFTSVSFAQPTKDAKLFAYAVSDGSKQRALFVPNYLDEFVQSPTFRRGFTEQKVFVVKTDGSLEKPFEIKIPKAEGAGYLRSIKWAADNQSLIVDRVDKDTKRRQLFYVHNVGGKDEQTILITEETDEKWIGGPSRTVEPNPKNDSQILFTSERDGFNHLYLATLERAKPQPNPAGAIRQENSSDVGFTKNILIKQLTKGAFEIDWAKWTADGKQVVFSSTENNTATRDFYVFDFETMEKYPAFKNFSVASKNNQTNVSTSVQNGMKTNPQIDEKNSQPVLLYQFSQWNSPTELFVYPSVCPRCNRTVQPQQITKSAPESFKQIKWNEPKFVDVPTRDGKKVKTKIYLPMDFNKTKKYPAAF